MLLIADGAGAHQRSVCEQSGIAFEKLPAACPEPNPAQRFFEELRKELFNKVFASITKLENYRCRFLKEDFDQPESLVQLCHYPYIRDA